MPMKFTLGMFMCSLGFLTAAAAGMWFADAQGLTSPWFIVLVYLFQSLGELFISALGLAMIAALVPQHLMGFILGMWFLTQAAAFLLGGYVATFTAVPDNITDPLETLPVYTNVFGNTGRCSSDAVDGAVAETHDCDAGKPLIILAESRVALSLPWFTFTLAYLHKYQTYAL